MTSNALSKITKVPWDKLDGYTKNALERAGVDERIWRIWGEAKHTKRFGTSFLTTQDVREIDIQGIWTIGAKTPWMRDALQATPAAAGFPAA